MPRRGEPRIDGGIDVKSIKMALFGALAAVSIAGCGSGGGEREFVGSGGGSGDGSGGNSTQVDPAKAIQVRIGTGNEWAKVLAPSRYDIVPVFNETAYGVVVTDSAGQPVQGVALKAAVFSSRYRTGRWVLSGPQWAQQVVGDCEGEDSNENLLLDAGEDTNRNGQLTPGNVGTAYFGAEGEETTATTDNKGSALVRVRYPRDRNEWVQVKLRVTAVVSGSETSEDRTFWLPVLPDDLILGEKLPVPPPGEMIFNGTSYDSYSPYGTGACPS